MIVNPNTLFLVFVKISSFFLFLTVARGYAEIGPGADECEGSHVSSCKEPFTGQKRLLFFISLLPARIFPEL